MTAAQGRAPSELLLVLPPGSTAPLRDQLRLALLEAIASGRLVAGDRLPPSRQLARDLAVSRGTVVEVYAQLREEGYLSARPGLGTTVAPGPGAPLPPVVLPGGRTVPGATPLNARSPSRATDAGATGPRAARAGAAAVAVLDLRPGAPDLATFPRTAWASALTSVLRDVSHAELGYVAPWGAAAVREQVAGRLARTRMTRADADAVVMVSGVTQALSLLCRVLHESGHRALAVEDPSNAVQREVLARSGLRIVPVPVDAEGIDVAALARCHVRAVLVTPAHQYPTGVQLSPARRAALLAWARASGGLVVEDDYDSEFRFAGHPAPSLQGSDPDCVALAGSASKTLAPGLRLGWLVPPPGLLAAVRTAKRDDDFGGDAVSQRALAGLLASGGYDRHVRRQRAHYRARRTALVAALRAELPGWSLVGAEAGLHLTVTWPGEGGGPGEAAVVAAAARRGLLVQGLGSMRYTPGRPGLVLCYARLPERSAERAARLLATAVAAARREQPFPSTLALVPEQPTATTALDYFTRSARARTWPQAAR